MEDPTVLSQEEFSPSPQEELLTVLSELSNKETRSSPNQPLQRELTVPFVPMPSHLSGPHSLNPHYEDDLRADVRGIDAKAAAKSRSMAKKRQQGKKFSEINAHFVGAAWR